MRISRRRLLHLGLAAGAGLMLPRHLPGPGLWTARHPARAFAQPIPGGTLPPGSIPKYVTPLVVPPAMPKTGTLIQRGGGPVDYYEIAIRQFTQPILPPGMPVTPVWSYGSVNHPGTFNYPAFTIEARFNRPVRVKWINGLVDTNGAFRPHLLPVDPTLHWANPPGGPSGRDSRPSFASTPGPYRGPVPIVTHLHGGHSAQESDGYAEAWYLPVANGIPAGFARTGSWYEAFKEEYAGKSGTVWDPGTATFQYDNDQRAATLWFHDHTLGMTRLNVYAGPAGFYLLRHGPGDLPVPVLPGPTPDVGDDPFARYYEIPIAIQDRSFNANGSLFYPGSREFFDGFGGPYIPSSDVPPIWNPEFFGNTMVVNGRTWPYLEVERRRYRLRFLNGCNSRFLILKITTEQQLASRPANSTLPFWQIGAEGGFLPRPVPLAQLLMAPAERADVIVDFSNVPAGTRLYLINEAPDEPFGGGSPGVDFPFADPGTTGQVMQFRVVPFSGSDRSMDPARLTLPAFRPIGTPTHTRAVSLNEEGSTVPGFDGPIAALLGTAAGGNPEALGWDDPITENPALNAIETWELYNFTEDAHPIHIHEVQFQVVNRQPITSSTTRSPEAWETGLKDTVIAYPEEITRVRALFDLPGLYVWHCHIVEHEDNEMMRPYFVGPNPPTI